ncbi:MAG: ABC transporter ATP-binding protein [Candidatus Muiribacteriota bacterium]
MIELRKVVKKFGSFTAVNELDLKINKGEILGLLGPNGAGKTTTMRMITGFFPQTAGEIEIAGQNIIENSMECKKKIGYLPESNPLYLDMKVNEYLGYVGRLKKIKNIKSAVDSVMEKTGLTEMRKRMVGNLSKGYRQRVGIAQALINEPEILILDEPTVGLDPKQIIEIRNLIRSFAQNHTVIISTHILPEVSVTCDRVAIMNRGKLIALDTYESLIGKYKTGKDLDVFVELSGDRKKIDAVLNNMKINFEYLDEHKEIFKIKINKPENEIRPELVKKLTDENVKLYEIYGENPQLENVFISLVTKEEEE